MQSEWSIRRYSGEDASLWDALVAQSRQGTLLHFRGYMEYHADRFSDCSLIALRRDKPVAILPANIAGDALYSHQGLTYGGWLTPRMHFDGTDMLSLFEAWIAWCEDNALKKVFYKAVPHIYHRMPAEEDLYALFRFGAQPWITNLSSVIDLSEPAPMSALQRRNLKKSTLRALWIKEAANVNEFMPMLEDCLKSRHHAVPVHSAVELQTLKDRYPESIRIFLCGEGDEPQAGVCVYDTAGVAHCQYIATSEEGRRNGALAYLMRHLIDDVFASRRYFDFGTSNEDLGRVLNAGLLHQKYGLGGRGIACQSFLLTI